MGIGPDNLSIAAGVAISSPSWQQLQKKTQIINVVSVVYTLEWVIQMDHWTEKKTMFVTMNRGASKTMPPLQHPIK